MPRYKGTFGTLRIVFKEEGRRGLFRGLSPALLCHSPAAALFFTVYTHAQTALPTPSDAYLATSSMAGALAWVTTCLIMNPLFVLKTKQQTQLVRASPGAPLKYSGLLSSARVVVREQGARGLYVGTLAAVAGFPGAMVQMPIYEYIKRSEGDAPASQGRVAAASGLSSAIVGIVTYPVDVVRLRLQAQGPGRMDEQYAGIFDGFRKILKTEGVRAFYRGCGTSLIRTVPQSAIALCSFETILRAVTKLMESVN